MCKNYVVALGLLLCVAKSNAQNNAGGNYAQYVNPFIGTGAIDKNSLSGSNFPGACTPFGLVQLSPDTRENPDDPASGYDYNDDSIVGFSHTHLSGTGVADLFDFLFMPYTGNVVWNAAPTKSDSGYRSSFSHSQEQAKPGYYSVQLLSHQVKAELTATAHCGLHRYSFPAGKPAHVIIDLDHSLNKKRPYWVCKVITAHIAVVNDHTIEGYRIITGWSRLRKVYFRAEFSQPFASRLLKEGGHVIENGEVANGGTVKAVLNFTAGSTPVLVKVGVSAVSAEGARNNLAAEVTGFDFDGIAAQAWSNWNKELSVIATEGSEEQKTIFYTGLYHAFTQPNNIADADSSYTGTDYTVRKAADGTHYSTFSLWDTYRAAHPLYTLVQQQRTAGFINAMLRQYETYGYLPIWQLWGDENYCMIGNHAIPVIVDAYRKGIAGVDYQKAYEAIKASSLRSHPGSPFNLLEQYHYFPEDKQSQSVSITLEIAYDDWCVAQMAQQMGHTADYTYFTKRSMYYRNLYDQQTGFFRGKNSNGEWLPFNPLAYGGNGGSPFTEGNGWQYFWYVPQDVPGLINLVGGEKAFQNKLDTFFTLTAKPEDVNGNASGFIGQYAHGNEPSHHVIYLYNYAGQPWKAQQYAAEVMQQQYNNKANGYSGNEDCGQMSAWYIFSAMGFYPVNPASSVYAIGSPQLKKAVIHNANGKPFTMLAPAAGGNNIYIQQVLLNGKPYAKTYITHADITSGATIEFVMGIKPNKKWGTGADSRPPASTQ
ncbi:alpha-1,2-mannosidase, putative [Filimonas lacunae]|uniref:Alpha-1,2-mannosidase, putative n=1 Tax=Filimonas lacunae TaxID=477680 RepID=A0A173ME00_9BACT|nr:GH92 family glycosyl hydrolase [Filimonas lacunae]BAV05823.1 alpha-1,2-mannosidase [Filimonas lacunae]SIT28482.1 alpha-1,2-mannosidase, putative [Filimonas lacunae]